MVTPVSSKTMVHLLPLSVVHANIDADFTIMLSHRILADPHDAGLAAASEPGKMKLCCRKIPPAYTAAGFQRHAACS